MPVPANPAFPPSVRMDASGWRIGDWAIPVASVSPPALVNVPPPKTRVPSVASAAVSLLYGPLPAPSEPR